MKADGAASRPSISVVIATRDPWQKLAETLERPGLQPGVCDEVIVVDGSVAPWNDDTKERFTHVRYLHASGASVFELRAIGASQAVGDIVAITEDHCRVSEDWCAGHVRAHERAPECDVVAGAVVNGSTGSRLDWANFLMTFGAFVPPFAASNLRAASIANVSFKRRAIAPNVETTGWLELVLIPTAMQEGRMSRDERSSVAHVQSHGLRVTLASHFHNGRSTTGLARQHMRFVDFAWRVVRAPLVPFLLFSNTARTVWPNPAIRAHGVACFPWIFLLCSAHAVGELTGLVGGPGRSPERME